MEDPLVTPLCSGEGLTKSYGGRAVIECVDVSVASGEIVSLIGPSGCGKTTLLRSLALLVIPEVGKLVINGRTFSFPSTERSPWREIYPGITLVAQQFPLWPHLRVLENLSLPLRLQGQEVSRAEIDLMASSVGVEEYYGRFPAQLSVGQRQRVALARALLLRPKILLLDEVTSAQDVEHVKRIIQTLKQVAAKGTAVIIATHLIGFAHRVGTRFCFMDNGRIIEEGGIAALRSPRTVRLKDFLYLGGEL